MSQGVCVRPNREVFAALCEHNTQGQIASMYGVCRDTVRNWSLHYGVQPRRLRKARPKPEPVVVRDWLPATQDGGRLSYWVQA